MVERIELALGPYVFDARADGPPDGELVLLLHGFPQTGYTWRHQLPALAREGYRAVAPDLRGYSPRARPPDVEEYRVPKLVGDVLGFADTLGADIFHVVGHDWGGALAWQVAGRHGDRVRTLTSVSTPHPLAMRESIRHGEQREKSGYMQYLRTPEAETFLSDDDGAGLRMLFEASGLQPIDAGEYLRHFREPGAVARRAELVPGRRHSPGGGPRADQDADALRLEHGRPGARPRGGGGDRGVRRRSVPLRRARRDGTLDS